MRLESKTHVHKTVNLGIVCDNALSIWVVEHPVGAVPVPFDMRPNQINNSL
jgi:hypothetical protein